MCVYLFTWLDFLWQDESKNRNYCGPAVFIVQPVLLSYDFRRYSYSSSLRLIFDHLIVVTFL